MRNEIVARREQPEEVIYSLHGALRGEKCNTHFARRTSFENLFSQVKSRARRMWDIPLSKTVRNKK